MHKMSFDDSAVEEEGMSIIASMERKSKSFSTPNKTEESEESFYSVTKVVNNMFQGTQQFLDTAKEKIMGDTWWIPSDNREIVVIPSNALKRLTVKKQNDIFELCHGDYASVGTLYHVSMRWKEAKRVSIFRSKQKQEAGEYYEHLVQYVTLFPFIQNQKDLKTLLSLMTDHSSWQPVHLAAKMGLKAFFEKAKEQDLLKKYMAQTCQPEQNLPLHIVIENNHIELAKYLLSTNDTTLSATDGRGQNALHYSSLSSSQMIQALCEFPEAKECINWLSKDGYTPLFMSIKNVRPTCTAALLKQGAVLNITCQGRSAIHEAMLQNKGSVKEVIKTLVDASPDALYTADPTTGNSAFHLATNKTSLNALLEVCPKSDLNSRNKNGQTALHCHTYRGDLGCVVALAAYNVDLDAKDLEGNTALHIAVYNNNLDIVKGLLVLGANPNVLNSNGQSPRHVAARSKDKSKIYLEFEIFLQDRAFEKVKSLRKRGEKMQVLLSLDGGGIRGLILVKILMFIEKQLGEPLINYVDWVAGTSTGSFLGAGLATGKSLKDCQNIYLRFKDQLFESWVRPYSTEVLEKLIKLEMGENVTLGDIERPRLMITTAVADVQPVKLQMFRSYTLPLSEEENEKLGYTDPKKSILWKALRCSSAAPTYFASFENKFVDGGLVSNNPTTELMSEVHKYNAAAKYKQNRSDKIKIGCVLSIGTGRIPDTPVDCLNVSTSNPYDTMKALTNLGVLLVDQVTATEGLPVERARSWCHDMKVPYFRFSTPLSKEYVLDTKEDKEVIQMMWETIEYMCREKEQVTLLIELLKSLKS